MTICRTLPRRQWCPRLIDPAPQPEYKPVGGDSREPIAKCTAGQMAAARAKEGPVAVWPEVSLLERPIDY